MVIEVAKHNASIVSVGENVIACSNITEAFLDVFSIDYGRDFAIIKQAHRYINNNPIIKVDVVVKEQLYKDVEFILIKSEQQGIFINENSLASGILIEQHQMQEIAEEDATVVDIIAEQMMAVVDSTVVDESMSIDVVDLKQQAKMQQQNKIAQHLQTIQEELSDQVSFELQQTKQSILTEALNLQDKLQQDGVEMVQQSIEVFRQQLKDWALSTEHHLTAYAEEAIADVEHQWTEKCVQLLDENREQSLQHLQQDISTATINSMAAIKEKLSLEIANHLKMVDESNAKKDADIDAFVQKQISQLHEQIEQSQMHKFDAKVAELLIKQHEWLQQNINETTDAYDEKIGQMSNELNKVVAEASTNVVDCIKNADATIEEKIQNALQQLNATAQQLHEQRMQSIEQSVAQVLKENIADEQTDVISEARSSARNAVRDALASYKTDVSKDLNAQLMNIQKELHAKMQIYVQSYGGGGSVAMQFADGGTMNGTLNVSNGQILSAGVDLATIFAGGGAGAYQTLTFNESNGFLSITPFGNTVSLSALSGQGGGSIVSGNYLPLSGGNLTGSLTINGTLSSSQLIYDATGNSSQWNGAFTTVQANSASWAVDSTIDAGVRALTATWQNTSTAFASQSANNASVFTTVNANSASWSASPYLSALNDVYIPAPVNGQVLTYNSITNKWNAGTPLSASGATGYYGSFYDTTAQTLTSATQAKRINIAQTYEQNGVSIDNNRIVFNYNGVYELIYSIQYKNTSNAQQDIYIWLKQNGVDIPNSSSVFTIPAHKNASIPAQLIAVSPFMSTLTAGNFIELYWHCNNTAVTVETFTTHANPTIPDTPGVIVTVKQVTNVQIVPTVGAYLPLSGGTLTGAVSTNQDIEITDLTKGIILRSPGNVKYRVTVSDAGELITTLI